MKLRSGRKLKRHSPYSEAAKRREIVKEIEPIDKLAVELSEKLYTKSKNKNTASTSAHTFQLPVVRTIPSAGEEANNNNTNDGDHVLVQSTQLDDENNRMSVHGPVNANEFSSDDDDDREIRRKEKKMSELVRKPEVLQTDGNLAENWRVFKRNFDIYFDANELEDKSDKVKINVFLNIIGSKAVDIFDEFKLPADQRATYAQVVKAFDDFCKAKTNPVYERFIFSQRVQKEGESFDAFHIELKRLIKNCEFGDNANEMLRDRIVIGVTNRNLQKKLLETIPLTYDVCVAKCKASEATQGQAEEMNKLMSNVSEVRQSNGTYGHSSSSSGNNNNSAQSSFKRQPYRENKKKNGRVFTHKGNDKMSKNVQQNNTPCKFCNLKHKLGSSFCPAYGKECGNCHKLNHFRAVCRIKNANVQSINAHDFDDISNMYVHSLTQVKECETLMKEGECNASATNIENKPVWREDIQINRKFVAFKVDTGSDVTILPKRLMALIAPGCRLYPSKTILRAFGGNIVRPIGTCVLFCFLNGKQRKIEIEVVDFEAVPLLG